MCNVVITVTPPLAVSVTETECVVTTQVRPLPTAAEIALALSYRTLPLLAGLCQLSDHCHVAAVKRQALHPLY